MEKRNKEQAAKPHVMFRQMDMGSSKDMPKNVNLFRGEVNVPLELVSLSNSTNQSTLSIKAHYSSNVSNLVSMRNREADTGIMGVGWNMPIEKITMDPSYSALNDDETYYLQTGETTLKLIWHQSTNEYIEYQTNIYCLWRIRYYKDSSGGTNSYWEVMKEDGTRYIYGTYLNRTGKEFDKESAQEIRLRENNWSGSSVRLSKKYSLSWYLTQIIPHIGTEMLFFYENTMAAGGRSGTYYTRSSRLAKVTDYCGTSIDFHYQDKEDFEVDLPYPDHPSHKNNAFQFYYQEKYLDRIHVEQYGSKLFDITFEYLFMEQCQNQKRYLSSVKKRLSDNADMPSYSFSYDKEENIGALQTVRFPTGAVTKYRYEKKEMPCAKLDCEIESPIGGSQPNFYHGGDYEVIVWKSKEKKSVYLSVCSWNGSWIPWNKSSINNVKTEDIQVRCEADFFAMYYKEETSGKYRIHVFRRGDDRYGVWQEYEVKLGPEIRELNVETGTDFVAYQSPQNNNINFITYNHVIKNWTVTALSTGAYEQTFLMTAHNNCVMAGYKSTRKEITYTVFYHGGNQKWNKGSEKRVSAVMDLENTKREGFFSGNNSFGTATFINNTDDRYVYYSVHRFIMDDRHRFADFICDEKKELKVIKNPFHYTITSNEMIFNRQTVYRFNGLDFVKQETIIPNEENEYIYNGYNDLFVTAEKRKNTIYYTLFQYDPYKESWGRTGYQQINSAHMIIPQVSEHYCLIGNYLYNRDSEKGWQQSEKLPNDINVDTAVLGKNNYLIYQRQGYGKSVYLQYLKEGKLYGKSIELKDQIMPLDKDGSPMWSAGSFAFVTFVGSELKNIKSVRLHYPASEAKDQKLTTYTPVSCTVEDGYRSVTTSYEYEAEAGYYDKYLKTAMFSSVKIAVGEKNGWEQRTFYNNNDQDGSHYLNGNNKETICYDNEGNRVSYERTPFITVNQLGNIPIQGIAIRQTGKKTGNLAGDGFIEEREDIFYNEWNQPCKNIEHGYDSQGREFTLTTERNYAWQYYDGMKEAHKMDSEALISIYRDDILIEAKAFRYRLFADSGWAQSESWKCCNPQKSFSFGAGYVDGWQKTEENVLINQNGQLVKHLDVDGIADSYIYDKDDKQVIARARNTDKIEQDFYYTGFESYEKVEYEVVESEASLVAVLEGEAVTGSHVLKIVGNGSPCGIKKRIPAADKEYLISFFVKTVPSPLPVKVASITSRQNHLAYIETEGTGTWEHVHFILPKESLEEIELFIYNESPQSMYVDHLFMTPYKGGAEAIVYNKERTLALATVNCAGRISRTGFDSYGQQVLKSDDHTLQSIEVNAYPNEDGSFDKEKPSAVYRCQVVSEGYYDDFSSSAFWKSILTTSDKFQVNQGMLSGKGKLTIASIQKGKNAAIYFQIKESFKIFLNVGKESIRLLETKKGTGYLLFIQGKQIMLLQNGNLLAQKIYSSEVLGEVCLIVDGNMKLDYIGIGYGCTLGVEYKNAVGHIIQSQVLNQDHIDVNATAYDERGNEEVSTCYAAYDDGWIGYKPGFFQGLDPITGKSLGEINEKVPKAKGFPFSRTLYEKSPLAREIEKSIPGKEYAYIPSMPEKDRKTKKIKYLSNSKRFIYSQYPFFSQLPEGKYHVVQITEIDGKVEHQMVDSKGNIIGRCNIAGEDTQCNFIIMDLAFRPSREYQPNFFKGKDMPENFVNKSEYDFLGRLILQKTIDSHTANRYCYDQAGRLIYLSDAKGQANGYIIYRRYDEFGRMISEGYVRGYLENGEVKKASEDIALKEYVYDGTNLHSLGKLIWQLSQNEKTRERVIEKFDYDHHGRIISKVVSIPFGKEVVTRYCYDVAGNTTRISCEEDNQQIMGTLYQYNNMNKLEQVQYLDGTQIQDIVTYTYAAGGVLKGESYADIERRTYEYNASAMLTDIKDSHFTQNLSYFRPEGVASAQIQSCHTQFLTLKDRGSFLTSYQTRNEYDGYGQLISSINETDSRYHATYSYDLNMNITAGTIGGQKVAYHYRENTNALDSIQIGETPPMDYRYDENGNVKAGLSNIKEIEYDKLSQLSSHIELLSDKGGIDYSYTADDYRIVKKTKKYQKYYIRDLNGNILMESTTYSGGTRANEQTFYIQGLGGIIGLVKNETFCRVVKDHLGSTRAIVCEGRVLSAYNYMPFGEFMGSIYHRDNEEELTSYLYTQHEYEWELALYNFGARLYDPITGRFLSIDAAAQFPSPYAYCGNSPLMLVDENGDEIFSLTAFLITLLIGTIVGTVASVVSYLVTTPSDKLSWGDGFKAAGIGALTGLISGAISGVGSGFLGTAVSVLEAGASAAAKEIAKGAAMGLLTGAIGSPIAQLVGNALNGDPLGHMVWQNAVIGGVLSAIGGGIGGKMTYHQGVLKGLAEADLIEKWSEAALKKAAIVTEAVTWTVAGATAVIVDSFVRVPQPSTPVSPSPSPGALSNRLDKFTISAARAAYTS